MKVKMKLIGLTFSQVQAGAYAVILAEDEGVRRVPILIGTPEAQAIAIFLDNLNPPRPLTHDLFTSFMNAVNVTLTEVYIRRIADGVFYSDLIFSDGERQFVIDARTSDAIAISIRTDAILTMEEDVLVEAGVVLDDEELFGPLIEEDEEVKPENMSLEDLQQALNDAIETEDYEQASYLRDIISQRFSAG
jgi:bifunctional DNase/RNase